jgi:osmoprotectant transport system permease protein
VILGAAAATVATQRPLVEWDWVIGNSDRIWDATVEHLYLTSTSVGLGLAVSLALALVALRWRRLLGPILGFGGVLYTIPSLAAFALLIAFVPGGRYDLIVIVTLSTYTVLILVRNIVSGIDGVPPEVVEAAAGMGYRRGRRFLEIELPLALPVVVAGVRIATVTVIGLVTVSALLGRGGLGAFILTGFRTGARPHPTMIVVGTVLSVLLAIVVDLALLAVERLLTPWSRRRATA